MIDISWADFWMGFLVFLILWLAYGVVKRIWDVYVVYSNPNYVKFSMWEKLEINTTRLNESSYIHETLLRFSQLSPERMQKFVERTTKEELTSFLIWLLHQALHK